MNNKQSDNPIVATKLILSICFGYGLLMLCRTVVGVAGPAMLADPTLNIDTATFGAILGWGTAGNLMGKVTTGALADKIGGSKIFISAIFFAAIATFIFGTLSTNSAFFVLYFLTVFAKAAGWPSIANIIRARFSENRHGRIWGFIATSSRISSVATTLLASSLLLIFSWRGMFFSAGILTLLIAAVLIKTLKEPKKDLHDSVQSADADNPTSLDDEVSAPHPLQTLKTREAIGHFIRSPRFWLISLGVSALAVLFEFQVFLPIYLSETYDLAPAYAGIASSTFSLGCLVAVFSGGFIYDKLTKKSLIYALGLSLTLAVASLLLLRVLGDQGSTGTLELTLTVLLIFLFGFAISPAYYIPMSVFSISFGGRHCGLLVGLIDAIAYFGAMSFDFIGGAVANKEGGWQDFILILIVTSVLATIIMTTFLYLDYRHSLQSNA